MPLDSAMALIDGIGRVARPGNKAEAVARPGFCRGRFSGVDTYAGGAEYSSAGEKR